MSEVAVEPAQQELDALWLRFKQKGEQGAKDALLVHYIPLVRQIVRRMMPKYNSYNEYDDLVQSGVIGLIDAVDRFDPGLGVKFETYAITRVRGEILDHMRAQDWAPSSLRKKINIITRTFDELELSLGESPSDEAVAAAVGLPVIQVQKVMAKTHTFSLVGFEDTLSAASSAREVAADEQDTPEAQVMDREVKRVLAELIETLPEKERLVITLYYYEELILKEIAQVLGVTESRVSQIHSKVLTKMKQKLAKLI
jgi:RNA polymerase sigma factor, FliA/WhiG family